MAKLRLESVVGPKPLLARLEVITRGRVEEARTKVAREEEARPARQVRLETRRPAAPPLRRQVVTHADGHPGHALRQGAWLA